MRVIPVPNQSDNYAYLLIDDVSKTAAAVDPFDVPKVTAAAEKEGVQIVAGITTHHHADHSGGNKEFVRRMTRYLRWIANYPLCPRSQLNILMLLCMQALLQHQLLPMLSKIKVNSLWAVTFVSSNVSRLHFSCGPHSHNSRALHTPCHTQDSICFYVHDRSTEQKGVFTGYVN